jgi:UDP-glucose 4-epimerase
MKCLITGVAGFIGSSLADELLAQGHEVLGLDCFIDYYPRELKLTNIESARASAKFTFLESNLLQVKLESLLEGVDWVFHQAAQAGVRSSWGAEFSIYTENNILATQSLLEACKSAKANGQLKKLIYASSSSVYGDAETLPTSEKTVPQPISPYGVSKLAAEHLVSLYAKGFGLTAASLRYFTVYGPRQRPDMAFNRFIRAALQGEQIVIYGDGEQSRDFTFISDIVRANIEAAKSSSTELVFNIGGGSRVTVNQVLELIKEITGKKLNVVYHDKQRGDARHTGADTSLVKQELGFSPAVSLAEGLERETQWMESKLTQN